MRGYTPRRTASSPRSVPSSTHDTAATRQKIGDHTMGEMFPSLCRSCVNCCPVIVEVEQGKVVRVEGDRDNAVYGGYSCVKGRAEPEVMYDPNRLLHSQKRRPDGTFEPIAVEHAMDEVAAKLEQLIERYGPRSVAGYFGTMSVMQMLTTPFLTSFIKALGSPMNFSAHTIDKPGKLTGRALHGYWGAPPHAFDRPDVALLVGLNPYQSYFGAPSGNPGKWIAQRLRDGMQLIVVDPRRSDLARRAALHIQPKPGTDIPILACLINVILTENLVDREFVDENVTGVDTLRRAVGAFAPDLVAAWADVPAEDLVRAARTFATAKRGYVALGVGPSFSSSTTLVEYLSLNLETLCGHWFRAGEKIPRTATFLPSPVYKAQATPPYPACGFGEKLRVHGLTNTASGMPTGVLADEILLEGEGQVRALISVGGNPVSAWPDQLKAIRAMKSLDLLVQIDPWMSSSARLAHYVIATKRSYEVAGVSNTIDNTILMQTFYGTEESYAQYSPALVAPPEGSELIEDWEFFYGVAQRMGLGIELNPSLPFVDRPMPLISIDMHRKPTTEQLIERFSEGGRVPLSEVKRHPHGSLFPEPAVYVEPKDPGWTGRLDVGNGEMMNDLAALLEDYCANPVPDGPLNGTAPYPFRLIHRRVQQSFNSTLTYCATSVGRSYNPAFLHPADLEELGVVAGDVVEVGSRTATIRAIVQPDDSLRRGLVSIAHGFGDMPDRDDEFREIGSPAGRLLDGEDFIDRYMGMPRMGNIPVAIRPLLVEAAPTGSAP
jgi:anaerobic selenocysteine-containing dehydrogenase